MATSALRESGVRRVKAAALARELGVTRQAIHDLQERGVLPRTEDGLIDVELARHAIASRVRPSGKTASALSAPADEKAGTEPDESRISYMEAKRLGEIARARTDQIKLRQLEGELVSRDGVRIAASRMSRMLRDSVLGVPSRISQLLAHETDSHKIEQALTVALRASLDDVAKINAEDLMRIEE